MEDDDEHAVGAADREQVHRRALRGTAIGGRPAISARNDTRDHAPMKSGRVSLTWALRSSVVA